MSEEIIGMDDMMAIYEVTDRFGIDRESIGRAAREGGQRGRPPTGRWRSRDSRTRRRLHQRMATHARA